MPMTTWLLILTLGGYPHSVPNLPDKATCERVAEEFDDTSSVVLRFRYKCLPIKEIK
jgi:hypothetical protein